MQERTLLPRRRQIVNMCISYHTSTLEATQGQALSHSPTGATSGKCYLPEAAFEWELTEETIYLGCLQGGLVLVGGAWPRHAGRPTEIRPFSRPCRRQVQGYLAHKNHPPPMTLQ